MAAVSHQGQQALSHEPEMQAEASSHCIPHSRVPYNWRVPAASCEDASRGCRLPDLNFIVWLAALQLWCKRASLPFMHLGLVTQVAWSERLFLGRICVP